MIELMKNAVSFAIAGVMLAIMLISCIVALSLAIVVFEKGRKMLVSLRAAWRYNRAQRRTEEKDFKVIRHGKW